MILKERIKPGTRFGRLTIIRPAESVLTGKKNPTWHRRSVCRCDCGRERIVRDSQLRNGKTTSCGCYRYARLKEANTTHNESKTKLYDIRLHMIDRCTNPKCKEYNRYGGRGIAVCNEWIGSYEAFRDWAKANGYRDGLSLDRIDNDKGYSPENCRFTDRVVQSNNRSDNHRITWNGETHTMKEWSVITGIHYSRIRYRATHNWPVEQIFGREVFACGSSRKRYLGQCKSKGFRVEKPSTEYFE